ncbi:hypothetical protein [Lacinutrix sp. Bg11-31]|uniref:hypothetical protein n=1 Tax=Lacinutrix sp. Bg11-31 TaxID=2057808 RepID=UPI000C31A1AF|nr:hypothetical protein [Lacinutrix sp. Bg11-31]AUC81516.1 hypothetical protein CW733_04965 [Lacinutrix sp. Bg11-31]
MKKIREFLKQQIFPGINATIINKKISETYVKQKEIDIDISEIKKQKDEYISKLKNEVNLQLERKIKLEDKAKSLLFIITLAITTITFSLDYLKENANQIIPIIFIFFSITHFVIGGIRALQTLNIKEFNIDQTNIELNNNKFKIRLDKKASSLLKELIRSRSLNELIHVKIANLTYASFILIRNGLVLFVLFFISTITLSFMEKNEKTTTETKFEKTLNIESKDLIKIDSSKNYKINQEIKETETKK